MDFLYQNLSIRIEQLNSNIIVFLGNGECKAICYKVNYTYGPLVNNYKPSLPNWEGESCTTIGECIDQIIEHYAIINSLSPLQINQI